VDKFKLSEAVAEKLNIKASQSVWLSQELASPIATSVWLHDDDAVCHRLACDHNINVHQTFDGAKAYIRFTDVVIIEPWVGHTTKYQATNVAILKCILESL
jgi:hypothetical protein